MNGDIVVLKLLPESGFYQKFTFFYKNIFIYKRVAKKNIYSDRRRTRAHQ